MIKEEIATVSWLDKELQATAGSFYSKHLTHRQSKQHLFQCCPVVNKVAFEERYKKKHPKSAVHVTPASLSSL